MVFDAPLALALAPLAAILYWIAAAWARRVRSPRRSEYRGFPTTPTFI